MSQNPKLPPPLPPRSSPPPHIVRKRVELPSPPMESSKPDIPPPISLSPPALPDADTKMPNISPPISLPPPILSDVDVKVSDIPPITPPMPPPKSEIVKDGVVLTDKSPFIPIESSLSLLEDLDVQKQDLDLPIQEPDSLVETPIETKLFEPSIQIEKVSELAEMQSRDFVQRNKIQKSNKKYIVVISIILLLIAAGTGAFLWFGNPFSAKGEKYFVIDDYAVFQSDKDGNIPLKSGMEVMVLDKVDGHLNFLCRVKSGNQKGYVRGKYLMSEEDYNLLESTYGNQYVAKWLDKAAYKNAVVHYYKTHAMGTDTWKLYASPEENPNTMYKGRIVNKYNQFNDLAVIFTNIYTQEHRLVLFTFDAQEESFVVFEQESPKNALIQSIFKDSQSDDYEVVYASDTEVVENSIVADITKNNSESVMTNQEHRPEKTVVIDRESVVPQKEETDDVIAESVQEDNFSLRNLLSGKETTIKGKIGNSNITMFLEKGTQSNYCTNVVGYYYYTSRGSLSRKNISGTVCGEILELSEINGYGSFVGNFKGKISRNGIANGVYRGEGSELKFVLN